MIDQKPQPQTVPPRPQYPIEHQAIIQHISYYRPQLQQSLTPRQSHLVKWLNISLSGCLKYMLKQYETPERLYQRLKTERLAALVREVVRELIKQRLERFGKACEQGRIVQFERNDFKEPPAFAHILAYFNQTQQPATTPPKAPEQQMPAEVTQPPAQTTTTPGGDTKKKQLNIKIKNLKPNTQGQQKPNKKQSKQAQNVLTPHKEESEEVTIPQTKNPPNLGPGQITPNTNNPQIHNPNPPQFNQQYNHPLTPQQQAYVHNLQMQGINQQYQGQYQGTNPHYQGVNPPYQGTNPQPNPQPSPYPYQNQASYPHQNQAYFHQNPQPGHR